MDTPNAESAEAYLSGLPPERRAELEPVLVATRAAMPRGYEERWASGMLEWSVPLATYPRTYNGKPLMYAALAAQKNHMALYLMAPYMDAGLEKRLRDGFSAAGLRLDMGKSCIRFRRAGDLDLETIGDVIASVPPGRFIAMYEAARARSAAQ